MRNKNYKVFILITFLGLLLISFFLYLETKRSKKNYDEETSSVFENVPDLYDGANIDIEETRLLRGRFVNFENGIIYVQTGKSNSAKSRLQVLPDADTQFDCISRYMQIGDQKVDRLNMYLDTSKMQGEKIPVGKNLEWFSSVVELGEAVEIRLIDDGGGGFKPGIIYVYKDACPAK